MKNIVQNINTFPNIDSFVFKKLLAIILIYKNKSN